MKRVIFIIISSHNHPIYEINREITRLYLRKMQDKYKYRFFFIEHKPIVSTIKLENDTLYFKGEEHYDLILHKTHKAFNYINEHYEYDIVIRTNMSSFWNLPVLYEFLETLENEGVATGICGDIQISGTGIILSKDVCMRLCKEMKYIDGLVDDVVIRKNIESFMKVTPAPLSIMHYLTKPQNDMIPDDISKIVYFRVLSEWDRMKYDKENFIKLLKKIYDIDYIESRS